MSTSHHIWNKVSPLNCQIRVQKMEVIQSQSSHTITSVTMFRHSPFAFLFIFTHIMLNHRARPVTFERQYYLSPLQSVPVITHTNISNRAQRVPSGTQWRLYPFFHDPNYSFDQAFLDIRRVNSCVIRTTTDGSHTLTLMETVMPPFCLPIF